MSRLRPFRSRVGVAGAAGLAALSLLVTSLTPLALRASAAEESTQATDVVSSQDGATASSDSEAAAAPAAEAGVEAPAADTDTAGADAADADAGSEAPAAEVAPEDQPRTRRARSTSAKPATLAMTVTNDSSTLAIRDKQITTINYACSSVTTPCEGASIEVLLPAPVTPAGTALTDKLYTAVAVTGSTVLRTEQTTVAGNPRMKRLLFPLQRSIPAGTSDRIQITWTYDGNDAPNNSTTTQQVNFTALNADSLEDSQTTKWTADTDIAIEKSGPTNPNSYPAVGGETTYKLRYGYQQIDQTNPNKVVSAGMDPHKRMVSTPPTSCRSRILRSSIRFPRRRNSFPPPMAAFTMQGPTLLPGPMTSGRGKIPSSPSLPSSTPKVR